MSVFKGPFGFWLFPILNALFPGGIAPIPGRKTITKPIWQSYKLQIPWNWMMNDTEHLNVPFTWDPSKTTIYEALLQGDAVCDQGSNYLDVYFNEQKVAPLTWGGSEGNATKTFRLDVKSWLISGNNTIFARGGKDYYFPSTVNYTLNATLFITYSGVAPTFIPQSLEASIAA